MDLSYKWLKEYVDFDLTPQELADKLTASGVAVEGITNLSEELSGLVVAYVEECGKHPDADKLSLCKVYDGQDHYQVVCGAANVAQGQKIIFAKIGAVLPGNFKIKAAKLRGVDSQGMICSAKEIGIPQELLLPSQKEGILELDSEAPLGMDGAKYLDLDDYILELDLTPDRGDCLSVLNVARQLAAILNTKVKEPAISLKNPVDNSSKKIDIKIEDLESCPRYVGKIIENVIIGESPFWMQSRLRSAGLRPINNVVDVTNYVLLEMGQPLHAFDYEMLSGNKIIVRKARQGEKVVTLDSQERTLDNEMLLICDGERPVAIAGVMGAENSEVTSQTKTVMIESAYFNPVSIRKTSTKLGLRSEASARFEKGINYDQTKLAAIRAAQLLEEIAQGTPHKEELDVYPEPIKNAEVRLRFDKANKVLGTSLEKSEIKNIFARLNLEIISENESEAVFKIPGYRPDLQIEEDLIEEIASIYGLENIPVTLPYGDTNPGARTLNQKVRKKIFEILSSSGANEVINYSFINPAHLDKVLLPENDVRRSAVEVLNPLSEEQGIMRTTLVPGMLDNALRNHNRRSENILTFEIGKVYYKNGFPEKTVLPEEELKLAFLGRGKIAGDWKNKDEEIDFYYLKGILNKLFDALKISGIEYVPASDAGEYHPGRCAKVLLDGDFIGYIGEINPKVADNYSLSGRTYLSELHLDKLIEKCENKIDYKYLPKYPGITRDLALLVDDTVRAGELIASIENNGGKLLESVEIFDLYQGSQIPEGKKSIAFSLKFQAEDRTLTDEDVNVLINKIKDGLEEDYKAKLRD
jgi:phenylalanyl-tRNA synthetase beta chain